MLTLLTGLFGFATSLLPDFLKFLQDKSDKKHELEVLKLQMQQAANENQYRLEQIGAQADIAEMYSLGERVPSTDIAWITGFAAIIRPFLALAFFMLFAYYKVQVLMIIGNVIDRPWLLDKLWTNEDQALFASIMGFYFGSRAAQNIRRGK